MFGSHTTSVVVPGGGGGGGGDDQLFTHASSARLFSFIRLAVSRTNAAACMHAPPPPPDQHASCTSHRFTAFS
jgi:hypothetical protein